MKKMTVKITALLSGGLCVGLLSALMLGQAVAAASNVALDKFPKQKLSDQAALQHGAKLFVNHCLNCHSASAMRYNRMQDLGLTEEQIKTNLLFTSTKAGDLMTVSMKSSDAKTWFGVQPPDLSLTARARSSRAGSGSDWIYTYLRSFYRDAERPTGWNNVVFENVGMPHILWALDSGARTLQKEVTKKITNEKTGETVWKKIETTFDEYGLATSQEQALPAGGHYHESVQNTWVIKDQAKANAYDDQVADIVAFMTWMAEPQAKTRVQLGVWVLIFLFIFTILAWGLNRAYWKDVK